MSVTTYPYEAHFKWKWHHDVDIWAIEDKDTVSNKLISDMKTAFLAEFAEVLSAEGHWYKMDDVQTSITAYNGGYTFGFPVPGYAYDVEGETIIYFQSDIKDASAHNSPQLWQAVQDAIWSVINYLTSHPGVVVAILAVGVLTILSIWLINTGTGALLSIGKNAGALILSLGILGVGALALYALFFTKGGRKAARKTYQTGKRAYRAVRRRR